MIFHDLAMITLAILHGNSTVNQQSMEAMNPFPGGCPTLWS